MRTRKCSTAEASSVASVRLAPRWSVQSRSRGRTLPSLRPRLTAATSHIRTVRGAAEPKGRAVSVAQAATTRCTGRVRIHDRSSAATSAPRARPVTAARGHARTTAISHELLSNAVIRGVSGDLVGTRSGLAGSDRRVRSAVQSLRTLVPRNDVPRAGTKRTPSFATSARVLACIHRVGCVDLRSVLADGTVVGTRLSPAARRRSVCRHLVPAYRA